MHSITIDCLIGLLQFFDCMQFVCGTVHSVGVVSLSYELLGLKANKASLLTGIVCNNE